MMKKLRHTIALEIVVIIQKLEYGLHLSDKAVSTLDYFCIRLLEENP